MAGVKSSVMSQVAVMLLLVVVLGTKTEISEAQNSCPNQLSNLNVCAAFVVPGAPNAQPSAECCSALGAVDHECLCSTLRIASQLPSQCQLPPLGCGPSN